MRNQIITFIQENCFTKTNTLNSRTLNKSFWKTRNADQLFDEWINITSFLPTNASFAERYYCLINNITEYPLCKICNNPTGKFINYGTRKGYPDFCSTQCSNRSDSTKQKKKKTTLCNYGVEYPSQSKTIREKVKNTVSNKYGVEHPMKIDEIKQKVLDTKLQRYGTLLNYNKVKVTNIKKYGTEHVLKVSSIRQKICKTNKERYGFSVASKNETVKTKIRKTMCEKYGGWHTQQHYSDDMKKLLVNREELFRLHYEKNLSLKEIADHIGVSHSNLNKIFKKHNIEVQRKQVSYYEKQICNVLDKLGIEYVVNTRRIISPYEIDIFVPSYNIGIEFHGIYWHCEYKSKNKDLLATKTKTASKQNIKLIHIFEDEWINKNDIVISKLKHLFGKSSNKIFARNTKIQLITAKDANDFYDNYHIQGGTVKASCHIGLYNRNVLVACASFKKMKSSLCWDLIRYATSVPVVGGFSKLLSWFKKNYDWEEIITFADRRWSQGDLYLKNRFEFQYNTKPNYFYVDITNSIPERLSRQKFMKHKLKYRLSEFNEKMTENENCNMNGLYRIYDAGHMKFKLSKPE